MTDLTVDEKMNLISRGLKEATGLDILRKKIEKRPINIYWGTAPTGRIHLGYFVPLLKIADFLKAGCNVIILIADLHAFLDNMKSDLKTLDKRREYYEIMIKEMLILLGVDISKLTFVLGTDFQLTPAYTFDVYRLNSLLTVKKAKRAGAEVVKMSDDPIMTSLLYPSLQALDEVHLRVDAQFGGVDQRKIFVSASEHIPKLDENKFDKTLQYFKRSHLMNEMVPGISTTKTEPKEKESIIDEDGMEELDDNKMSASKENSKIDILDGKSKLKSKINSAYCLPCDDNDNSLMIILEKVLFKIMEHRKENFIINRADEYGGKIEFENIDQIRQYYKDGKLHPDDFKKAIVEFISNLLEPIRKSFESSERRKLLVAAYGN